MKQNTYLSKFRNALKLNNLDAYIQPRSDMFGGEEVPDYDARLKLLSGFTGSAGIAVITLKKAILFTDGRYTLQARMQLNKSWEIHPLHSNNWIDWVTDHLSAGQNIGFDPWLVTASTFQKLSEQFKIKDIAIKLDKKNLVDQVWINRPKITQKEPVRWKDNYFAVNAKNKVNDLLAEMQLRDLDALIITQPNQVCWLLNIRGNNLKYTPFFLGFLVVEKNGDLNIFSQCDIKYIKDNLRNHLFYKLEQYLSKFKNKNVAINNKNCPSIIYNKLKHISAKVENSFSFLQEKATIKHNKEIQHIRRCHIADGVALANFFYWIENNIKKQKITEYDASEKLKNFRAENKNFICESFPTIAATGSNGAIIHYRPDEKKSKIIDTKKLFLIDSGGQYFNGTTDITRTVAFEKQSSQIIDYYTYVLKAHISLAKLVFRTDARGSEIDAITRKALWEQGMDYNHGTGHGVGYCLGVHEFPPTISKNSDSVLMIGQLLSNEPGFYIPRKFGIRLENLILVKKFSNSIHNKFFCFETVSFCHFENTLINKDLLDKKEVHWLNNYHETVFHKLKNFLSQDVRKWLRNKTKKI